MNFDIQTPNFVSLDEALERIHTGWLAQFRGLAAYSQLIQRATGGPHSHSAMLRRTGENVDVLELRIGGGRAVPLEGLAESNDGLIDVFRPDVMRFREWDPAGAADYMRYLTARGYGWRGIWQQVLRNTPGIWRLLPVETSDISGNRTGVRPFCSHAVCTACRIGGMVDPVPRKPDYLVTPNDLTHSLFFDYAFTIVIRRRECLVAFPMGVVG